MAKDKEKKKNKKKNKKNKEDDIEDQAITPAESDPLLGAPQAPTANAASTSLGHEKWLWYSGPLKWLIRFVVLGLLLVFLSVCYRMIRGPLTYTLDDYLASRRRTLSRDDQRYIDALYRSRKYETCETMVYLIRHAEKGQEPRDLDEDGWKRARYLPELFCRSSTGGKWWFGGNSTQSGDGGNTTTNSTNGAITAPPSSCRFRPPPARIYARKPEWPTYVKRSIQTVIPLSQRFKVPIDANYSSFTQWKMATLILNEVSGLQFCNSAILVCWKHSLLEQLMIQMGCDPYHIVQKTRNGNGSRNVSTRRCNYFLWAEDDFDSVAVLKYRFDIRKPAGEQWSLFLTHDKQNFV